MKNQLIGPFEALKQAWALVQKNLGLFLGISITSQVILSLLSLSLSPEKSQLTAKNINFAHFLGSSLILVVASMLMSSLVAMALIVLVIKTEKGEKATFNDGLEGIKKFFFRFIGVEALTFLAVLGGFVLLIIPGIIFGIWFFASTYVLIDQNKQVKESMTISKGLVKGYTTEVFTRFFAAAVFSLIVSVAVSLFLGGVTKLLPVGVVITTIFAAALVAILQPLGTAYTFVIYRSLQAIKSSEAK